MKLQPKLVLLFFNWNREEEGGTLTIIIRRIDNF